jgi:streptogramin lyase
MFELDFKPSGIVATADAIWAEDHAQTNRVYSIDPMTGKTTAEVTVRRPCDVIAAFDRVWIADLDAGQLLAVDPSTNHIEERVRGLNRPCGVQAVDGAIWLAVDDGLARVDPQSGHKTIVKLAGAAFPGPGTPLWAVLYKSGKLVRVDTESNTVRLTVPPPPKRPTEAPAPVPVIGFGSLWVGGATSVYRLDPQTGKVQAEIPTALESSIAPGTPAAPSRFLVTQSGVWLTSYESGAVERIDPSTNTVVYRAELGLNPNGIAQGFGAIWVADTGEGRLYRLDPTATGDR